jgi:dTDP-4-dehydrorhamnose 3,5-epimerase
MLLSPRRHGDERGWFMETYNARALAADGFETPFVQDNLSLSKPVGTLRGIHFQAPPDGQDKLVRCARGRILDIAVDLRRGSPTYGKWVGAELSAENGRQLLVPIGFGHAFVTLEPDCEVAYKCTALYAPASDGGVRWDDPDLAIDWPLPEGGAPVLSDKDRVLPTLAEFTSPFEYDGRPLLPIGPDFPGTV